MIFYFLGRTVTESKEECTENEQKLLREILQASDKYISQADGFRPALNPNLDFEPPMVI